jgi:hypothetical protein
MQNVSQNLSHASSVVFQSRTGSTVLRTPHGGEFHKLAELATNHRMHLTLESLFFDWHM